MQIKNLLCSIIAATALFFVTYAHADSSVSDILVTGAWVQAMPPSQTTSAAYLTITNNSAKEAVLISASSDIAGAVELHQMSEMKGMMSMAMVPNIHIPAHGKVELKPGGYHIMLINLKKPFTQGIEVPITLHFQDGGTIIVKFQVKEDQGSSDPSMPGMDM